MAALATPESLGLDRGRLVRFKHQLQRIPQRAFQKPVFSHMYTPQVRDPYPPLGRIAPPRTRPHTPVKQGLFHARVNWPITMPKPLFIALSVLVILAVWVFFAVLFLVL